MFVPDGRGVNGREIDITESRLSCRKRLRPTQFESPKYLPYGHPAPKTSQNRPPDKKKSKKITLRTTLVGTYSRKISLRSTFAGTYIQKNPLRSTFASTY